MRRKLVPLFVVWAVLAGFASPVGAEVIEKTLGFSVDTWKEIEGSAGTVSIHRIRVATDKGGFKAPFTGALNEAHLEQVSIQIEYTNEGERKVKSRIAVRWLDADGEVIDGFETNEGLNKRTARGTVKRSISTSRYGISRAETLEVEVTLKQ